MPLITQADIDAIDSTYTYVQIQALIDRIKAVVHGKLSTSELASFTAIELWNLAHVFTNGALAFTRDYAAGNGFDASQLNDIVFPPGSPPIIITGGTSSFENAAANAEGEVCIYRNGHPVSQPLHLTEQLLLHKFIPFFALYAPGDQFSVRANTTLGGGFAFNPLYVTLDIKTIQLYGPPV